MPGRVLVPESEKAEKRRDRRRPEAALRLAVLALGVLIFASVVDLGALWWPVRLGNLEWEFATLSATADSLPLVTLSLVTLSGMALWQGWVKTRVLLALVFGFLTAVAVVLLLLHALNLPIALQAAAQQSKAVLIKAGIKTILTYGGYVVLYAAASWTLIRSGRAP